MAAMENKLLSLDQVADHLRVHRDTVYKLVRSGRLPALQLGGRKAGWRVAEEDLQKFISNGKTATVSSLSQDDEAKLQAFDASQFKEMEEFKTSQAEKRTQFLRDRPR
jgi:excisionase family DNA binding protein